jgi:hypothetical protein
MNEVSFMLKSDTKWFGVGVKNGRTIVAVFRSV